MLAINLDYRLEKDCIKLGYLGHNLLLLMNNCHIPWLILVPSNNGEASNDEFDLLPRDQQIELLDQINQLGAFLRKYFKFDKLNIATIGNVVRQLHIHVVARSIDDYCWPDVVWGNNKQTPWNAKQLKIIIQQLESFLPDNFKKHQQNIAIY